MLTLHHLVVYPINFSHLKDPSLYREEVWSSVEGSPVKFLDQLVGQAQKQDLVLSCSDQKGEKTQCRYTEIFAAVAGACFWNKLYCYDILGYDAESKELIPLKPLFW